MHHFTLNQQVAAEVFEDECIIANLDSGLYYSVQGIAAGLIQALPCADPDAAIATICASLGEHRATAIAELSSIWQELISEQLVVDRASSDAALGVATAAEEYKHSELNRYADMQDLLLLDPIHDVDEDGWELKEQTT